jgi:hypothetical protein
VTDDTDESVDSSDIEDAKIVEEKDKKK